MARRSIKSKKKAAEQPAQDCPTMPVETAAKELKVGRNQAYAACARGEIPAIRIGKRWLVLTVPFRRLLRGEAPSRDTKAA